MKTDKTKRTIKNDPFADLIPDREQAKAESVSEKRTKPGAKSARPEIEPSIASRPLKKAKITLMLDGDLVERIKNAVYWNPSLTVAGVAMEGIKKALKEIEDQNQGPYPVRNSELRAGRPLK
jgi:uncharacterized protein (DUF4415 family)